MERQAEIGRIWWAEILPDYRELGISSMINLNGGMGND